MNIFEIKSEVERNGSVVIPTVYASVVMQECKKHGVEVEWTFKMNSKTTTISRPMRQDEDHPPHRC